jgi:hypothetical protein
MSLLLLLTCLHVFLVKALFVFKVVVLCLEEVLEDKDVGLAVVPALVVGVIHAGHREAEETLALKDKYC